jgi:hypothetical protein
METPRLPPISNDRQTPVCIERCVKVEGTQSMMLIMNIGRQPDANEYQNEQHGEREPVHDHALSVIVFSIGDFKFSEVQYQ